MPFGWLLTIVAIWAVWLFTASSFLNYEENNDYKILIKNSEKYYKYTFYKISSSEGILVDGNASIYTVYNKTETKIKAIGMLEK